MSFGGFGGFGSSNNNTNNNQSGGFGGFGASTTNNAGGFGTNANNNTGFGASTGTTGGGLFGGGSNAAGGFGAGGFGGTTNNNNNATSTFGAKPAFGSSTTGGGLFGNAASNAPGGSSFGGFGGTTNNQAGGFGASTTGGSLFGGNNNNQAKPAFGATNTTPGGGLFGGGATSGFGGSTGSTSNFGFGQQGQQAQAVNQGTGSTPFAAHTEKDPGQSSSSHFQSITFMQPYQNFSFEELRLADYNAGRRFGNSNGQAGAFGQSTGFGGFGTSNNAATGGFGTNNTASGGLFGGNNNNTTTTPSFGQNNTANTGSSFGGGGLFGNSQNKPATGGLFGNNNATTSGTTSGGLFGTANNATTGNTFGGFGASNNNTATGTGLFGNTAANNQNTAKPFGGFGTTNTAGGFGANTTGFGGANNQTTGGTLFGGSTATNNNAFGSNLNNTSTATPFGGGFGQNTANQGQGQQNNTTPSLFGGFGSNNQNQQKPGGLFGTTGTTGGGLFGNNNNQQQNQTSTPSLFGNNNNNQQAGGLFGSKPATTGTGLFGNNTNNNTAGTGGLFGNANANQNQGASLFGQQNNNQQKSLFGSTNNNTGGGLFGGLGQSTNNNSNNLFGNSQQNNNAGATLFGNSQQNQQQQQPQSLTASLMQNPYGNDQLFAGLGSPAPSVGPLATPLSGAQKPAKRPQSIPAFKINPSASMRLITPQKRPNGYGFSYSTYGTPSSASGFTPGRSGNLFSSGALNRPLSKSLSTSNLRTPLAPEDSVLAPNAFTPNYRPYSSGNSIRRLKIDRTLRSDLFGGDQASDRANKRVNFDGSTPQNGIGNGQTNGSTSPGPHNALVRADSADSDVTIEANPPARTTRSASKDTRSATGRPEMEQVRGNELAIVPEDEQVAAPSNAVKQPARQPNVDQEPGEYWSSPTLAELRDMSRDQLKDVSPFIVGRHGIGKIEFSKVDLTTVPLDQIIDNIVQLRVRSATVYQSGVNTPPQGKGLNVPSTIFLENSWPRSNGGRQPVNEKSGARFDKHVVKLKRVKDTEFINYDGDTGEWVFKVQHFTTYGLDDDDDESMADDIEAEDTPNTPTPKQPASHATKHQVGEPAEDSLLSPANTEPDDTFDFKKSGKTIPGGFGDQPLFESEMDQGDADDAMSEDAEGPSLQEDPFNVSRGSRGVISPPETDDDEADKVVGAFPDAGSKAPKSILKAGPIGRTPAKDYLNLDDDWAEQLQRTISPRKQDRRALREQQDALFKQTGVTANPLLGRAPGHGFNTTMDIMKSLWAQPSNASVKSRDVAPGGKGFEWPYNKRPDGELNTSNMSKIDRDFHNSVKPRWSGDGTLVYAAAGNAPTLGEEGLLVDSKESIVSEGKDVRFARFKPHADTFKDTLRLQLQTDITKTMIDDTGVPSTSVNGDALTFTALAAAAKSGGETLGFEHSLWRLAALLFDPIEVSCTEYVQGVPTKQLKQLEPRIRRDAVLDFWKTIIPIQARVDTRHPSREADVLLRLGRGDVEGACTRLVDTGNVKLATIIAQLPSGLKAKESMQKQIDAWRDQNALSEISPVIRALYEIAAGNFCISEGKSGAAEDRAPTFGISEHFGLNWEEALGLRLFYDSDDLGTAVQHYVDDVAQGREKVHVRSLDASNAESPDSSSHHDGLLGLLQLYASASNKGTTKTRADDVFAPIAFSGHPFNFRLSWQLATLLSAKSKLPPAFLGPEQLDDLTNSFAHQLECADEKSVPDKAARQEAIFDAASVLLHLSDPAARVTAIRSLISRRIELLYDAGHRDDGTVEDVPAEYLREHHIPVAWLHRARAQHISAQGDFVTAAERLIDAGDLDAAHSLLVKHVGPRSVVARNYDSLRELLGHFVPSPVADGGAAQGRPNQQQGQNQAGRGVSGWRTGGQVYFDYVHLLDLAGRRGAEAEAEKAAVLRRLVAALPSVRVSGGAAKATTAAGGGAVALEERVAIAEMSRVVEAEVRSLGARDSGVDEARLGRLPLPDEGFVTQGGKLWALYGRALQVR